MTDWMSIRVVLHRRDGEPLAHPPGRVLLAHTRHSFAELAQAVDVAFARWDLTPVHEFTVEGHHLVSEPELADAEEPPVEASHAVALGEVGLRSGARFTYVFDLGEGWTHECTVEAVAIDPFETVGGEPGAPVPVFGWGTIPDQYGRLAEDEDEDEDELAPEPLAGQTAGGADLVGWVEAESASWAVVAEAISAVERPRDHAALSAAAAMLRAHVQGDGCPYDPLWAIAGLDGDQPPADDEQLWLTMATGVVAPRGPLGGDPESEAAWAALEPADWAGAVIELVRGGPGEPAAPEQLVALVRRCPEVEGDGLTEEDLAVLTEGFGVVVGLWRLLGAVDSEDRLTPLGLWGLPEALRLAWTGS